MRLDLTDNQWVEWDQEAGTFSGPAADLLDDLVDAIAAQGQMVWAVTAYPVQRPRHDEGDLALVLASLGWYPPQLAEALASVETGLLGAGSVEGLVN
jgi:hypothetical protein